MIQQVKRKESTAPCSEEKEGVEKILFLLDKFCVGDLFYREISMITGVFHGPIWSSNAMMS